MDEQERFDRMMKDEGEVDIMDSINGLFGSLDFISYVILGSKFIGSDGQKIVYDRDKHQKAWFQMEKDFGAMNGAIEKEEPFPDFPEPAPEEEEDELLK